MDTPLTQRTLGNHTYWEELHGEVIPESPTVILLHWMTGTYEALQFLFSELATPARLIYLQAAHPSGFDKGGYSWFPRGADFYELSEAEQAPLIKQSADNLADFISQFRPLVAGKLGVTGFSQGGDLSLALATYYPQLIDVAISGAGRLSAPMRPPVVTYDAKPRVYMHVGTADHVVSVASSHEVAEWLKSQGYKVELHQYEGVEHEYSPEMIQRINEEVAGLSAY